MRATPRALRRRWGIMLRPPIEPMRARPTPHLPDLNRTGIAVEPKWDGWRAVAFVEAEGVFLQSRAGRPLHRYFPDVCRHLALTLPPGTVVDGELVAWETSRARTSFGLLQRRVTAGRRLLDEIRQHPAHLVVFDLLQDAGMEVLRLPLVQRRVRLARLLTNAPPELPLCPLTIDRDHALAWYDHGEDVGIEGLVVKALAGAYRLGRADWLKVRNEMNCM
ncbi:hypothetical protein ACQEVC_23660 [Plantactinospora sp. CA-294935]|uniref:ATP-dependent DNA ligase n=1 Tax=Plantactinospora sp. CA-294935 TaxID=3240012 RepID=UPI003D922425